MQVVCVSIFNQNDSKNCSFKSAVPVFIQIKKDSAKTVPVVGDKLNAMFMRKTELMLNDSLKRGINPERDSLVDRFRTYFKRWVSDFGSKVVAFTCVDGEFKEGELKPYFYFLTGDTINELDKLRQEHKEAVAESQGYQTANLKIAKDNYYNKGKNLVKKAFAHFHPHGKEPHAMYVIYEPVRKKNGEIKDYKLQNVEFRPVNDVNNPVIYLDKQ